MLTWWGFQGRAFGHGPPSSDMPQLDLGTLYHQAIKGYAAIPMRFFEDGSALPPLRVAFILTHRCNLLCEWCEVMSPDNIERTKRQKGEELSTDEVLRVLRQVPRHSIVTFTGGEPFARKDLFTLLRAAAQRNKVHLVSNGYLITPEQIEALLDLAAGNLLGRGLFTCAISIQGEERLHDRIVQIPGAWKKTVAAIGQICRRRRERGLKYPLIDLKVVITRENVGGLLDLHALAHELGADLMSLQIVNTQGSAYGVHDGNYGVHKKAPPPVEPIAPEILKPVLEGLKAKNGSGPTVRFNPHFPIDAILDHYQNKRQLEELVCHATWTTMHIAPYGEVYPCFSYPMGNVRQRDLLEIWNGEAYRSFRRNLRRAGAYPGCVGCCVVDHR